MASYRNQQGVSNANGWVWRNSGSNRFPTNGYLLEAAEGAARGGGSGERRVRAYVDVSNVIQNKNRVLWMGESTIGEEHIIITSSWANWHSALSYLHLSHTSLQLINGDLSTKIRNMRTHERHLCVRVAFYHHFLLPRYSSKGDQCLELHHSYEYEHLGTFATKSKSTPPQVPPAWAEPVYFMCPGPPTTV